MIVLETEDYILGVSSQLEDGRFGDLSCCFDSGRNLYFFNNLQLVGKTIGNNQRITDSFISHDIVYTCGMDASASLWDIRSSYSTPVLHIKDKSDIRGFTNLSCNSTGLLAIGTEKVDEDAKLKLFDLRNPNELLAEINDSFGDDVTQATFHPFFQDMLCSASTDGLCCVFDTTRISQEDEGLLSVMNSKSSINTVGFFGPNAEYLYMLTHLETFSLWSLAQGEQIVDFGDRRAVLGFDYLIDCNYNNVNQELSLFTGNHDGSMTQYKCSMNSLTPFSLYKNIHKSTIRCVLWDQKNQVGFTGAEDGSLIFHNNFEIGK